MSKHQGNCTKPDCKGCGLAMSDLNKTLDSEIDEILESLVEIGRGWVIDQLDGTSFIKDALDGIEKEKAEARTQILALIQTVGEGLIQQARLDEANHIFTMLWDEDGARFQRDDPPKEMLDRIKTLKDITGVDRDE